ncbi:MAG: SPOR domain-containing protein, partial [Burkholderiales bacterium]|nr:SPOR domain-containing protein [Burkholderiales bacterium]
MPLPSFFRRKEKAPDSRPAPAADGGPVEAARLRARRRLIGAIVLLAVGVIGFPLVFETQPRPVAVDIPIVVPGATGAGHLASAPVMASTAPAPAEVVEPAPHAAASAATAPTAAATGTTPAARAAAVNPAPAPARNHLAAASEAPPRPPVPERPATPRPASPAPAEPPSTPARPAPRSDDGARALALLRGEGSATPEQSQR